MNVLITVTEQIEHQRVVTITEEEYEKLLAASSSIECSAYGSFMQESDTSSSNITQVGRTWRNGRVTKIERGCM